MATATVSFATEQQVVEAVEAIKPTDFVDYKSRKLDDYVEAAQRLLNRLPADSSEAVQLQSELIKAEAWKGQRRQDLARPVYESALKAVRRLSGFEPMVLFNGALPRPRKGKVIRR